MVNDALAIVENIGFDIHHKVDVTTLKRWKDALIKFNFTSKGRF